MAGSGPGWPVAIGDPKTPTPVGEFAILNKKVNPVYVSTKSGQRRLSGPSSPIEDSYGLCRNGRGEFRIHGTPWPHWVQIRAAVSLGCARMLVTTFASCSMPWMWAPRLRFAADQASGRISWKIS